MKNTITTARSLVLCHFSVTAPATSVLNKSATRRAENAAGAAHNSARVYNTVLTAKGTAIGRAISLQQRTGVAIRRFGLPCPAGGIYLRVKDITAVQNCFDDAMHELDIIREDILATYGDMVSALSARLGSFVGEVSLPTASEVARRFTMSLTILNSPVAVDGPVLKGLTAEVANRVRAESQQSVDNMLREAHAGPVADLKAVLIDFADKMINAERLHNSQFAKLRAEAHRLRDLNVLGIKEVADVVAAALEAAALETSAPATEEARTKAAAKAGTALKKADATLASLGL